MAANLTPQYHEADTRYRAATTPEEKLAALEDMWREIPKHKASEKLQAELKKKLSAVRKEVQQGEHKKHAGKSNPFAIHKTGAGQVVLIGAPNTGKSAFVGALTNAPVKIADFPFTTAMPQPGMVPFEDVQIQLIDTPPITADHVPPGFAGLWRQADAILVVADLASDAVLEDVEMCLTHLAERQVELTDGPRCRPDDESALLRVPGLVLATRLDLPAARDNLELLREFFGSRATIEPVSTLDAEQMARLPKLLFELVRVVRVYAKPPGRKADLHDPFILSAGADIHALAHRVYRGQDHKVTSARIWGMNVADGQHVQLDHQLCDRDVVELHG